MYHLFYDFQLYVCLFNNTDFSLSVGCFGIDAEIVDPKMHEMVSDRSSRAKNWTDLRKKSMRVFFGSKESTKKARCNKTKRNIIEHRKKTIYVEKNDYI